MTTPTTTPLLLLLLILGLIAATTAAADSNAADFIRTSCSSTLYPDLCLSSLAKYAATVGRSPLRLAGQATSVCLSRIRSAASRAAALYTMMVSSQQANNKTSLSPSAEAVRDCTEVLGDAVDHAKQSLAVLKRLGGGGGDEMETEWLVSDAQTWMSAALTKEGTCTDGLVEMGATAVELSERVELAKEYTSNALALVNKLRTW